jgi:hypothetical protein
MTDLVCHLIRHGYGSEAEIRKLPLHDALLRLKWFMKWEEKHPNVCPWMQYGKKK